MRVVIGEDNPLVRYELKELVRELGHEVVGEAWNGLHVIHLCLYERPDILLVDYRLPIVDGVEAVKEIRKSQTLSAIIVSGVDESEIRKLLPEAIFVAKPASRETLRGALRICRCTGIAA